MKTILKEARTFLGGMIADLRGARNHAGVLDGETLLDIAADADAQRIECEQLAYKARVADDEGITCLERALSDGIQASDLPAIEKALRHFRRSRDCDHQLAEKLG